MEPSNNEGAVPDSKGNKAISELHFNAINNSASKSNRLGHIAEDQKKLLPNATKYVITPAAARPSNNGNAIGRPPTNGVSSSEQSSTAPSSVTSPFGSPTANRQKHNNSMRSVRSGNYSTLI